MEQREKIFKKLSFALMIFYGALHLVLTVFFLTQGKIYELSLSLGGFLFLPLPFWIYRLLKMRPVYQLNFIVWIFCLLAYTLGLTIHFYTYVPYYDKAVHTLSGTFVTLLSLGLFYTLKPVKRMESEDFSLASVFSIACSIAVAGLWEICEYVEWILFPFMDPQNVAATGTGDTMQDMIVCTVGSLLLLIPFWMYYKKGKRSFLMGVFETFFQAYTQKTG